MADAVANYTISKASDLTDKTGASLQTVLDSKTRQNLDTINGVYVPLFQSATQFSKATNAFAVASGGGLVSASPGTTATGVIWLPAPVNNAQPWRFAALIQIGTDATHNAKVGIYNSANGQSLFECVFINGTINLTGGFSAFTSATANVSTAGTQYWVMATCDGNRITYCLRPVAGTPGMNIPVGGIADGGLVNIQSVSNLFTAGTSNTITASGSASNGATTIPVNALTNHVPKGTVLTWSGTGNPKTTTTADAPIGSTSLTVSATWGGTVSSNIASTNTATSGIMVFDGLNQIKITNTSSDNVVKGVFYNTGFGGGTDSRMQPPAYIYNPTIGNGETASIVCIPGTYTGRTPVDIVQTLHYNATEWFNAGWLSTSPDAGAAFSYLLNQGYIVCACRGTTDNSANAVTASAGASNGATSISISPALGAAANGTVFTWPSGATTTLTSALAVGATSLSVSGTWGGTASAVINSGDVSSVATSTSYITGRLSSNWGAPDGLAFRKALTDWIRANIPSTRNLYLIGGSMGGMNALNYAMQYPASVKAMILQTPATNLSYNYSTDNGGAYAAIINAAYTSTNTGLTAAVVGDVKDRDPSLRFADLINVPMKFWAASDDALLSYAQNTTAFLSGMAGVGVTVPVVIVTGGHVNVNASVFDGPNFAAFFKANP